VREREIAKLDLILDQLSTRLNSVVKSFPTIDEIHPFYRILANTIVPIDDLKQALAGLSSAVRISEQIVRESQRLLRRAKTPAEARKLREAAYGRISSIVNRLKSRLEILRKAAKEFRKFPSVTLSLPVIVVAGYPNVGKSSLVALISTAQPEIAEYPFTTKKISLGHFPLNSTHGQIVDIPGLLDRPMSERNPIEQRAIAAIQYLADCILFLIDPTLMCGYELQSQIALLNELKEVFPSVEIFPILNKSDIASEDEINRAQQMLDLELVPIINTLDRKHTENQFYEIIRSSKFVQEKLKHFLDQSP
jgi:nucleolar GTP-binding protein